MDWPGIEMGPNYLMYYYFIFFVQYNTTRSLELRDVLARAREKAEESEMSSISSWSPVKAYQRPAFQEFNQGQKQHTLSVKPSDFGSDESDGKYRFSGNISRSTFIKLIYMDDRNTNCSVSGTATRGPKVIPMVLYYLFFTQDQPLKADDD